MYTNNFDRAAMTSAHSHGGKRGGNSETVVQFSNQTGAHCRGNE